MSDDRQAQISTRSGGRRMVGLVVLGGALSVALVAWAVADLPGAAVMRWIALVPGLMALAVALASRLWAGTPPPAHIAAELYRANKALVQQVQDLTRLRDVMLALGATFDRKEILTELTNALIELLNFDRGLVLLFDEEANALVFGAFSHAAPDPDSQLLLEQLRIDLDETGDDPLLGAWQRGEAVLVEDARDYLSTRFNWLLTTLDLHLFYSVPLIIGNRLKGVILADNSPTRRAIAIEHRRLLDALAANIAVTLENARLYQHTDERLSATVQELQILSRIDRELNAALSTERVFNLTLDWALRFTGSEAGLVALVDHENGQLHFVSSYGPARWQEYKGQSWPLDQGIIGRVAQGGASVASGDVLTDPDYVEMMPGVRSLMAVPSLREDRVIAVIALVSQQPAAFTPGNLEFVERLAARAAAAIDNARLFEETHRERQKLEIILSNITDAVIVVDHVGRLVLVNQAALSVLRLPPRDPYIGRSFREVFAQSRLAPLVERALSVEQGLVEELTLADGRTFNVAIVPTPKVGWSVVLHDVTPFKETDKLKTELVATTSHDLKTPLGSILGYVDLIHMTNQLNDRGQEYMRRVQRAVHQMRQLIDDLLDMARIESGITLEYDRVPLAQLVAEVVEGQRPRIDENTLTVHIDIPPDLPPVPADPARLRQMLDNLVSNAVKYTPPEGEVTIRAEEREGYVHVVVRDTGLGISPEEQPHVFERFYRVRNTATDGIEGTGLGLAIVKSLVQAHGGQIGLDSRLGEGSTFTLTLPLTAPPGARWAEGGDGAGR